MVVHFVDICGYNHHCLKFLFANFIIFCTYSGLWEYIEQINGSPTAIRYKQMIKKTTYKTRSTLSSPEI
jgi:hypothetical protein